jgi:colanic acid biosynthesis glycosyl transferase WcaI
VQDLQVDAALHLGMLPPALAGMLRWLERFVLKRVDLVSTISAEMRRRLQAKTRTLRPVVLFPNWADTAAVRPWQGDNRFRRDWEVADGQLVVMYSGNLGQKQGVSTLLEAAALCRQDLLLVVAGEGSERAQLETHAARLGLRKVRFIGLAAKERLSEFLSAADLHCIPQRREAAGLVMPSKLLNIMAVARAVVVTADPGTDLARAIEEAACGLVAAPDAVQSLAEAIDILLGDHERRQRQGRSGRDYVERTLGIDEVVGGFADHLVRLVRATTPSRARA